MAGSYEMNMTSGPLLGKILTFSFPLMCSGVLQLLFNAADIIVVGRYTGHTALAAVGSTSALINLIVNLFVGLSVGANVLIARSYGAKNMDAVHKGVHTAMLTAVVGGVFLSFVGVAASRPMLSLMGTPDDVIDQAALYLRIYFVGAPSLLVYNFGAAILRAVGDTQRPLYFLFLAGIINVVLNLFFVIGFHLDVAGVAIATVISQCVSAGLVLLCLVKSHTPYRVDLRRLGLKKDKLWGMVKIGLPAGIQGCSFSISNVLIQSSINSFGAMAMAGNTAASNIEGFVSTAQDAFAQAALSFTGQNMGAGKTRRVNRILLLCLVLVTGTGLVLGTGAFLLGHQLLGIYSADPQVIAFGIRRMSICCVLQFVGGLMGVMVGVLRGMGYSFIPMAITIGFVCGFRVVWIFTVFAMFPTLEALYVSYPITWGLAALCDGVCFLIVHRHVSKKQRLATGARE